MSKVATLYLHFPCFDGTVSGVLAKGFLENHGWDFGHVQPVNYHLKNTWLSSRLEGACAVVDFLYHPDADFWADHHLTTFLNGDAEDNFQHRHQDWLFYDSAASSCASLLWARLPRSPDKEQAARFEEMVRWADRIDSARYESVEEAILGDAPALRVNFSLMRRADAQYCGFLVENLGRRSLEEVAFLADVAERYQEARTLLKAGLARFEQSARLVADDIVTFDITADEDSVVSRYAPFYFFPAARYSAGIVRYHHSARITAMRNPWSEFPSVPLGSIFEHFGGGGHQRVGALILPQERTAEAIGILQDVVSEIRKRDTQVPV